MATSDEKQIGLGSRRDPLVDSGVSLIFVSIISLILSVLAWSNGTPEALFLPSVVLGVFGGTIVYEFLSYRSTLKEVWLGERGLRILDLRREISVPYRAIEAIDQKRLNQAIYVVVQLRDETRMGRRFTFLPIRASFWNDCWAGFGGTHTVVTELRERVAAACEGGKRPLESSTAPARSVMADPELDGPTSGKDG